MNFEKKFLARHRSRTRPSWRRMNEIHANDGNSSKIINYTFPQNVSLQHRTNKKWTFKKKFLPAVDRAHVRRDGERRKFTRRTESKIINYTFSQNVSLQHKTNKKLTLEQKFLARHRSRTRPSRRRTKEIHANDGNSSKIINYTFPQNVSLEHRTNKKWTLKKKFSPAVDRAHVRHDGERRKFTRNQAKS